MYCAPILTYREKREEQIKSRFESVCTLTIGKSILGRDISAFKIGNGKQSILAVASHHAKEYITTLGIYEFIDFLTNNSTRPRTFMGISLDFLLENYSYYLVPALNPDGIELHLSGDGQNPLSERQRRMSGGSFASWQSNARGVDLNHNYDYRFAEYKAIERSHSICAGNTRYSGEYPESEPETRALSNLVRTLMPAAVVSFHTQGREIYFSPANEKTERRARRIASAVGYSVKAKEGFYAYGGLCDYTGEVLGIPSFTVELGLGESPLPESSLPEIVTVTRKTLILLPSLL